MPTHAWTAFSKITSCTSRLPDCKRVPPVDRDRIDTVRAAGCETGRIVLREIVVVGHGVFLPDNTKGHSVALRPGVCRDRIDTVRAAGCETGRIVLREIVVVGHGVFLPDNTKGHSVALRPGVCVYSGCGRRCRSPGPPIHRGLRSGIADYACVVLSIVAVFSVLVGSRVHA